MPAATDRKLLTARLLRSVDLHQETKHLEFEVAETRNFEFTAGQFISMRAEKDGREVTRAYSIASAPRGNNRFDLCLNRVEMGFFSNYLCDMSEGAEVKFHGPHGYFVLRNPLRDSLFIATGTGIAPMRGFLQWLFADSARHAGRQLWLMFGARYRNALYYDEEFRAWELQFPNFHYTPTLSREGPDWQGARGYVQEHVRQLAQGRTDMDAYICGLKDMVITNRKLLIDELAWEKKSVMFERFD
ncbi:MAG TPA: FAD-dependent oxidoreductase [Terriglobales bacterium]|nr:FAD-dependent oxidoreductase [Terriglobales bacterium]